MTTATKTKLTQAEKKVYDTLTDGKPHTVWGLVHIKGYDTKTAQAGIKGLYNKGYLTSYPSAHNDIIYYFLSHPTGTRWNN